MGELGKSVVDDDVSFDVNLSGDFTNTDDLDDGLLPTTEGESTLDDWKLGNGDDVPLAEDEFNISEADNFFDDSKSSDDEVPNDDFADMVVDDTFLENWKSSVDDDDILDESSDATVEEPVVSEVDNINGDEADTNDEVVDNGDLGSTSNPLVESSTEMIETK